MSVTGASVTKYNTVIHLAARWINHFLTECCASLLSCEKVAEMANLVL